MLPDAELGRLARQLAAGVLRVGDHPAPLRVAVTAATARQLAEHAQHAARLLRASGPAASMAGPDVRISAGAAGSVVVLFPGRAESAAGQAALLATSLQALGTLDLLGVRPTTGVGYGLGEITGLTWACSVPVAEAARLVAQCGQVLRACGCGSRVPAAMARVTAGAEVTRALCAPGRLHIAAYEGPRAHVLAGSTAGIREMARRAGALGVPVEVLSGTSPMHSPGMAWCAAPLRSIFAGTRFAPPRRRLVSSITGRVVMPQDDIAGLLASQVCLPVLFAQAMAQAAEGADLIVTAGPDAGLTARAAECGRVPAVAIPASPPAGSTVRADADRATLTQAVAALFAAGAIADLMPFLALFSPPGCAGTDADTLASRTVPRMRVAEQPVPAPPAAGVAGQGMGARTPVRSGKLF